MLESDNLKMTRRRNVIEENHQIELEKVKNSYDNEKKYYEKAVEELRGKYKDLKSTADGLVGENEKLLEESSNKNKKEQRKKEILESLYKEKSTVLKNNQRLDEENEQLLKVLEETETKRNTITEKTSKLENAYEEARMKNTDLKNKYQALSDEVSKSAMEIEREIEEAKVQQSEEIQEVGLGLKNKYENKLKDTLNELRDSHEKQIEKDKQDFKEKFEKVIQDLQTSLSDEKSKNNQNIEDNNENHKKIDTLVDKINQLEANHDKLKDDEAKLMENIEKVNDINKKEVFYDIIKPSFNSSFMIIQLSDKDGEISELLDKISDQQKDFQSLQETKAALDTEIAVYRKLMETEEDRMGLSETSQGYKNLSNKISFLKSFSRFS